MKESDVGWAKKCQRENSIHSAFFYHHYYFAVITLSIFVLFVDLCQTQFSLAKLDNNRKSQKKVGEASEKSIFVGTGAQPQA